MAEPSIVRLLKLVGNDWSSYQAERRANIYTASGVEGGVSVNALDFVEWDWGLLRHDIHVLIHKLRPTPTPGFSYKGYAGRVHGSSFPGPATLFGEVVGIRDVVTFESPTVRGLKKAFRDSVDDYLEMCAERGEEPQVPDV